MIRSDRSLWRVNLTALLGLFVIVAACRENRRGGQNDQPNVVIIFTDDQGYADLGAYGAEGYETPNLDRMADEGMRLTSFYVAASICSPSRAALLTGRYPMRVGLPNVLFPRDTEGLNPEELTMAEMLSQENYATMAIGKWHLGAHPEFLPTNHGFDQFFGLLYSNDMSPEPENNPREERKRFPLLSLIEDTTIVEREPDQAKLIQRYTERAVEFIDENGDQPFFLYYAHSLPHVPLYASGRFHGSTERGLYGDVIREIDWSVGQIIQTLEEKDLRENTIVIFTSDNGPWLVFGDHGGSAGNLREGKITTFEGGHRVPAIVSWPGQIPSGVVSDEVATTMDLFPTIAGLAGAELPGDRIIDGYDIWPFLSGEEDAGSPYHNNPFYFYLNDNLQAVRLGPWKLHVAHDYLGVGEAGQGGEVGEYETGEIERSLFNVEDDPGETLNVAEEHPEIVEQLMELIGQGRAELGDAESGIRGSQQSEPGRVEQYWQKLDVED